MSSGLYGEVPGAPIRSIARRDPHGTMAASLKGRVPTGPCDRLLQGLSQHPFKSNSGPARSAFFPNAKESCLIQRQEAFFSQKEEGFFLPNPREGFLLPTRS